MEPIVLSQSGLLVVGRSGNAGIEPFRQPALPSQKVGAGLRYKGLDGEPWPREDMRRHIVLEGGVASLDQYDAVLSYYRSVRLQTSCDIIYLERPRSSDFTPTAVRDLQFCGYDYGYYSWEYAYYSVILNEVIFGLYEQMRRHAQMLNGCLLFASLSATERLDATRRTLLATGADLEDGEKQCGAIAIYSLLEE